MKRAIVIGILFYVFASPAISANYLELSKCLLAFSGGHQGAIEDVGAATLWANELEGRLAETIPSDAVWEVIMANRTTDWRAGGGVTSGGKAITDADRDDVRYSVIGGGRSEVAVEAGSWARTLLLDVFGVTSATINTLQARFTEYKRRCDGFGSEIEEPDIPEAIRLYGDPL